MSSSVYSVDEQTYLIDGYDLALPKRTGTYVLIDPNRIDYSIIETGPSMSVPYIKKGLKELNCSLENLKYIIVTHIHLDHAGGAGLLLKDCPNATVLVHPKGARHLADPSRLIQGAKAVYGQKFNELFDPVVSVPEASIMVMKNNDTLHLSDNRQLTFIHTPGHANHHFSIFDSRTTTMFTGDTVGIRYADLEERDISFYLPSTSPNQFDPDEMLQSLNKIQSMNPTRIAFGHFGMSANTDTIADQLRHWLKIFINEGERISLEGKGTEALNESLLQIVSDHLLQKGVSLDDPIFTMIKLDIMISSAGIADYLKKKVKNAK